MYFFPIFHVDPLFPDFATFLPLRLHSSRKNTILINCKKRQIAIKINEWKKWNFLRTVSIIDC